MLRPFDPNKYGNPVARRQSCQQDAAPNIVDGDIQESSAIILKTDQASAVGSQPGMPEVVAPIAIPGFDPTRYGQPKKLPKNQIVQLALSTQQPPTIHDPHSDKKIGSPSSISKDSASSAKVENHSLSCNSLRKEKATQQLPSPAVCSQFDVSSDIVTASKFQKPSSNQLAQCSRPAESTSVRPIVIPPQLPCPATEPTSLHSQRSWPASPIASIEPVQETRQQRLRRIQTEEMKRIGTRNRTRGQPETTSLRDLELARRALPAQLADKVNFRVNALSNHCRLSEDPTTALLNAQGNLSDAATLSSLTSKAKARDCIASPKAINGETAKSQDGSLHHCDNQHVLQCANEKIPAQESRWATAADIKPDYFSDDSDAWDSLNADEMSTDSDDSVRAMAHGMLFRHKGPAVPQSSLVGWDGQLQPPPVDWNDRPRFSNDTPEFKNQFNNWAMSTASLVAPPSPDLPFKTIDEERVKKIDNMADGIDMVPCTQTVNIGNAFYYDYWKEDGDITKDSTPLTIKELEQETHLDTDNPANTIVLNETTELLVQTWLAHRGFLDDLKPGSTPTQSWTRAASTPPPNLNRPQLNIYLRPAVRSDIPQMTNIYNWHIEHGTKTAEVRSISDADMRLRFDGANSTKLPFIVAVERGKKHAEYHHQQPNEDQGKGKDKCSSNSGSHPIKNTSSGYHGLLRREKIVGWACAQDFTAPDFVEHISAEVEVYVDAQSRQQGVGRCLMDKLLDATDRGYMARGGYSFHCASEVLHMYNAGGGRDLHKILFVLRHWRFPKKNKMNDDNGRGKGVATDERKIDDREDEYDAWLREWIESWGFDVEGVLKGVGMKDGRFINIAYLSRETLWQPEEGRIPAPLAGTI